MEAFAPWLEAIATSNKKLSWTQWTLELNFPYSKSKTRRWVEWLAGATSSKLDARRLGTHGSLSSSSGDRWYRWAAPWCCGMYWHSRSERHLHFVPVSFLAVLARRINISPPPLPIIHQTCDVLLGRRPAERQRRCPGVMTRFFDLRRRICPKTPLGEGPVDRTCWTGSADWSGVLFSDWAPCLALRKKTSQRRI